MKDQFVPYELALKLKELGFDEECVCWYNLSDNNKLAIHAQFNSYQINTSNNNTSPSKSSYNKELITISAPLWQQAFDWFTRKGLHSYIEGAYPWFRYYINTDEDRYEGFKHLKIEEARQACLEKLIELCQQN